MVNFYSSDPTSSAPPSSAPSSSPPTPTDPTPDSDSIDVSPTPDVTTAQQSSSTQQVTNMVDSLAPASSAPTRSVAAAPTLPPPGAAAPSPAVGLSGGLGSSSTRPVQLSPAQRQYVTDNFGDLMKGGVRVDVSNPKGNGGQPVLTLQRNELQQRLADNPDLTYNVHTHYHGDIRPGAPEFQDRSTIAGAMKQQMEKDPDSVFVLPQTQVLGQARGTAPVGTQLGATAWNNVSDEKQTTEEALRQSGLDPARAGQKTVSGHSSGGYPLSRVMASTATDPSHPRIDANHILIMDTVRGSLADPKVGSWWQANQPGAVTYIRGTMQGFSPGEVQRYGWGYTSTPRGHFDAVRSFFNYGQ